MRNKCNVTCVKAGNDRNHSAGIEKKKGDWLRTSRFTLLRVYWKFLTVQHISRK